MTQIRRVRGAALGSAVVIALLVACGAQRASPVSAESRACAAAVAASEALGGRTYTMVKLFRGGPNYDVSISGSTSPFLVGSGGIAAGLARALEAAATNSTGDAGLTRAVGALRAMSADAGRTDAAVGGRQFSAAAIAATALERDEAAARGSLGGLRASGCRAVLRDKSARSLLPTLAVALVCSVGVASDNQAAVVVSRLVAARGAATPGETISGLSTLVGSIGQRARRSAARLQQLKPPAGRRAALRALVRAHQAFADAFLRVARDSGAGPTVAAGAALTRDQALFAGPAAADLAAASELGIGNAGCG